MNKTDFNEEIVVALGGNLMDVELTEKELDLSFKKAKRTFQQKGSNNMRREFFRLKVNTCQQEYMVPSRIDTIVKIIKPSNGFTAENPLAMATYNELFYGMGDTGVGGFDLLSYEFTLQKIETFHRYMAYDAQFSHDKHRNTVRFLKNPERDNVFWLLECYTNLEDDEYRDILWVQEWATAEAQEQLGKAYRKFSSIPGPDGSSVSLGGDQMVQEAQQRKQELIEDILNGVDGDPSYWEIRLG